MSDIEKASNPDYKVDHIPTSLSQGDFRASGQSGTVTISRDEYERLVQGKVATVATTHGNAQPLAIISFCLCLAPVSVIQLGWANATAASLVALAGPFYYTGGITLWTCGLFEWIVGNTFTFIVFMTFGAFWSIFGLLNDPTIGIAAAFASTGGAASPEFNTALMFYFSFFTVATGILFFGSLRTNVVFAWIMGTIFIDSAVSAASYSRYATGNIAAGDTLTKAAGGISFATILGGFYLALHLVCNAVDMPFQVPVGDLSRFLARKEKQN